METFSKVGGSSKWSRPPFRTIREYLLFFVSFAIAPLVWAQDIPAPAHDLQADLSAWYSAKFNTRGTMEIVVFAPPLAIDPQLNSGTAAATRALLQLTDAVPLPSPVYASSGRTTFSVYKTILEYRRPEAQILNKDQEHRLKRSERILLRHYCPLVRLYWAIIDETPPREPSKEYVRYQRYATRHAFLEAQLNASNDSGERQQIQTAIRQIELEWEQKGNKRKVADALTTFKKIQALDPESFWSDVSDQYYLNLAQDDGESLPSTSVVPPTSQWIAPSDWTSFQSGHTSGEIKLVDISRSWMNPDVLGPHEWTWSNNTYRKNRVLISDGKGFDTNDKQHQLMSVLPTQILLARHLKYSTPAVTTEGPVVVGLVVRVLPRFPGQLAMNGFPGQVKTKELHNQE